MTRIAAASGAGKGWRWQRISEYQNTTIAELCARIDQPTIFAGELDPAATAEIEDKLGRLASVTPAATSLRRAGAVMIGKQRSANAH